MASEQSHGTANETHKQASSDERQLIEIVPIEGTPFTAVRHDDKWFLALGKYRLTEVLKSQEQCIEESKDASWFRIMQIIKLMIEEHESTKVQLANALDALPDKSTL